MDLLTLLKKLIEENQFGQISMNTLAQFGTATRRYLGAELLPERIVPKNMYRENQIRYQTIVANDGTRYSPVQKKNGQLVGSMAVELGDSDIGREISAEEYDALIDFLNNNRSMEAEAMLVDWVDIVLNRALLEHNERQRWQAICNAQVVRQGDNGYSETVQYPNPAGHRFNAGGVWSNDSYDPFEGDILPALEMLRGKGFTVNRIITSTVVKSKLLRNDKVRNAVIGSTEGAGAITMSRLNQYFQDVELVVPETYDLTYRTQTGSGYFLPRNVMVFACTTERDVEIQDTDENLILNNTLGYSAIGRAAGQSAPGRVVKMEAFDNKPPRIEGEAWQTSLPVITEPDSLVVIGSIS